MFAIDFGKVRTKIKELEAEDSEQFQKIRLILSIANDVADFTHICKLPPIIADYHLDDKEEIHSYHLIATKADMISFLKSKNINV